VTAPDWAVLLCTLIDQFLANVWRSSLAAQRCCNRFLNCTLLLAHRLRRIAFCKLTGLTAAM
jgi:hypothetical protein